MSKIPVYNQQRDQVGEIELPEVFRAEVRDHLLYAAVRYQRAKARAGTHGTKQRAEVSGGGRKPWKQKGTGRARQGSTRSPHWKGGGVVFGPRPRSHAFKMNKKTRAAALSSALSRRAAENAVVVLDEFVLNEVKTRHVASFMDKFELADMVLVVDDGAGGVSLASRNLQSVTVLPAGGLNVYDVLRRKHLVLTREAVNVLARRFGGEV
jgi:large subunit ribosomal protein L4